MILPHIDYLCRHLERLLPSLALVSHHNTAISKITKWAGFPNPESLKSVIRIATKNRHSNTYHNPQHTSMVIIFSAILGRKARLSKVQMACLITYALTHDLDHRGANMRPHTEEKRSALMANRTLFGKKPASGPQQRNLKRALMATAFSSSDAHSQDTPPNETHDETHDEIAKILMDADILASIILPYRHVISLTKGLKRERRSKTPSQQIFENFISALAVKGFAHHATQNLAKSLNRGDMAIKRYPDMALKLGFAPSNP